MKHHFEGFPATAHPMAILSAMINAAGCFYPDLISSDNPEQFPGAGRAVDFPGAHDRGVLLPQSRGLPIIYPKPELHVHGELPAHDVLAAVPGLRSEARDRQGAGPHPRCCTPITSRTAPPRRSAWWPRARPTSSPAPPRASARCGARSTAARTRRCSRCSRDIHESGDDGSKFIDAAKDKHSGNRADGLRPPRLQELTIRARRSSRKPATKCWPNSKHQRSAARHRQETRGSRAARTPISSTASSIRTSISTAASSCARSAFR